MLFSTKNVSRDSSAVSRCGERRASRRLMTSPVAPSTTTATKIVKGSPSVESPNASRHMARLHDCGLVERDRRGREVHYRLADGVADLLVVADAIVAHTGERIAARRRFSTLGSRP